MSRGLSSTGSADGEIWRQKGDWMVSVVIPNYNGEKFLKDCLESLKRQTFEDMEVIMVDNGSTDDSVGTAKKLYPEIRVVELGGNTGFAFAVNRGIEAAEGEYVLLLNNDTIVFPNFVKNQYKMIKGKPDVFSCSALMIQNGNRELVDDAGDELAAFGWGFAPDRDKPVSGCMVPHEVFSSCAGAAIYRKSVFDEIGLFDESFFAYLEDMDVGCRARLAGYRNLYNPYAKVYHLGSASSGSRHNAFKVELSARNSMWMFRKNMPVWQFVLNAPFIFAGIIIKTAYFAKKGLVKAYLKGIGAGLFGRLSGGVTTVGKDDTSSERVSGRADAVSCLKLQMWLFRGMVKRIN